MSFGARDKALVQTRDGLWTLEFPAGAAEDWRIMAALRKLVRTVTATLPESERRLGVHLPVAHTIRLKEPVFPAPQVVDIGGEEDE